MEISRNKQHDYAFQVIYSFLILETCKVTIDFQKITELIYDEPYDEIDVFSKELLIDSLKYQNIIINFVEKYLKNWRFNRLNYCSQAILILSLAEYYYMKDVDKAVIINIAVKLAKKYAGENDYRFINGVLDNCLKENGRIE